MFSNKTLRKCAVCGDTPAKIHYGVLACFGCKGFFRRAVKDGRNKYVCRFDKNCEVTKFERNACRYCRFRKCLLVGMNPDFIRPDRENTNTTLPQKLSKKKSLSRTYSNKLMGTEHWINLLPSSQRKLLSDLTCLEAELQTLSDNNYEGVADFSLKSLIADRTLARKNKNTYSTSPKNSGFDSFLSIDKIVAAIDYIDGFIGIMEQASPRRISIEDKSSLISNTTLHLNLVNIVAKFITKGSINYSEDLLRIMDRKEIDSLILARFGVLCDKFRMFSPSVVEYSLIRAIITTSADSCILSNYFNELIMEAREALNELLFRVLKYSRGKSSVSAATCMSHLTTIIYEAKEIASSLRHELGSHYPRDFIKPLPFHNIITDIINPEISDLLVTMMRRKNNSLNTTYYAFSPPSLSPPSSLICPTSSSECGLEPVHTNQSPVHTFTAPQSIRPKTLGFCPKLPLTITKSIEEMLRPPGMSEDASIMNRPLARDWADGIRLTPVFNKDVVAQFFPELSGTPM